MLWPAGAPRLPLALRRVLRGRGADPDGGPGGVGGAEAAAAGLRGCAAEGEEGERREEEGATSHELSVIESDRQSRYIYI